MDEPEPPKGAMTLVYLVAIALVGFGLLTMGLYWGQCLVRKQPVNLIHFALPTVSLVAGVAAIVRAKAIAKWIADKLE